MSWRRRSQSSSVSCCNQYFSRFTCACAIPESLRSSCVPGGRHYFAGFMGALASQFWFLAFALATAASVRTLALVEVLFAQAISRFAFGQRTSLQEGAGIVLIVIGVILVLWAQ